MTFSLILSFIGAGFSIGLAGLMFFRDRHSFVHRTFAIGMFLLGLEAMLSGISSQAVLPHEVVRWQHIRLTVTALILGFWLIFSLTYARLNYKEIIAKWQWVLFTTFIVPIVLVTFFWKPFFAGEPIFDSPRVLRLGWSGYVFHLIYGFLTKICFVIKMSDNIGNIFLKTYEIGQGFAKFRFLGRR